MTGQTSSLWTEEGPGFPPVFNAFPDIGIEVFEPTWETAARNE